MKDMKTVKKNVSRTAKKAKTFLESPKGKKYGLIALALGIGAATMMVARARRAR